MLIADRDHKGRLVGIRKTDSPPAAGEEPLREAEILEFLASERLSADDETLLELSDRGVIRVLEDLVELLVAKNLILLTDLPEDARSKLRFRKETRQRLSGGDLTVDDIL